MSNFKNQIYVLLKMHNRQKLPKQSIYYENLFKRDLNNTTRNLYSANTRKYKLLSKWKPVQYPELHTSTCVNHKDR